MYHKTYYYPSFKQNGKVPKDPESVSEIAIEISVIEQKQKTVVKSNWIRLNGLIQKLKKVDFEFINISDHNLHINI